MSMKRERLTRAKRRSPNSSSTWLWLFSARFFQFPELFLAFGEDRFYLGPAEVLFGGFALDLRRGGQGGKRVGKAVQDGFPFGGFFFFFDGFPVFHDLLGILDVKGAEDVGVAADELVALGVQYVGGIEFALLLEKLGLHEGVKYDVAGLLDDVFRFAGFYGVN